MAKQRWSAIAALLMTLVCFDHSRAGVPCTLPFNLQNGTTADATQVMSNYNALVACLANAAAAGANNDITSLLGLTTPLSPSEGGTSQYLGGTSTGTPNAQVLTSVTPTNFSLQVNKTVLFIAGFTNTGPMQINVANTGLINVFKQSGAGPIALTGGEVVQNQVVELSYDGTEFQIKQYTPVGWGLTTTTGGPSVATVNPPYPADVAVNASLAVTVGSNLLTVTLNNNAGSTPSTTNPVLLPFRNGTGGVNWVPITAALSMNTNAIGATLACTSGVLCRTWVVAFYNGGTPVLALWASNKNGQISPLASSSLANTTGISNSATSAGVFYTPNGTNLTSQPFVILGYYEQTQVTAGTYLNAPSLVQLFGPGVRRPGEPTGLVTTCVSATCTINLQSVANLVRVSSSASFQPQTLNNENCQLLRGATQIGTLDISAASITSDVSCTFAAIIDTPQTASPVYQSSLGVGNTLTFQYTLEEIMG